MGDADRAGFERFVIEHGDRLLQTAYGLCGDWQHAEDLVQQALVAVARHWPKLADNPAGYAYRCLVRANIDRWRMLRRRPEMLLGPHELAAVGPATEPVAAEGRTGCGNTWRWRPPWSASLEWQLRWP